jgi:hypothetical protein
MSYAADRDCSSCGTPSPFADVCGECEVATRVNAARDKDEARIRAEAAAERTREIVLGLYEDAASWRTMAAKMLRDKERLMCDRRASVLEGRARAIASRYGVDGEPADAFPKPGSE